MADPARPVKEFQAVRLLMWVVGPCCPSGPMLIEAVSADPADPGPRLVGHTQATSGDPC